MGCCPRIELRWSKFHFLWDEILQLGGFSIITNTSYKHIFGNRKLGTCSPLLLSHELVYQSIMALLHSENYIPKFAFFVFVFTVFSGIVVFVLYCVGCCWMDEEKFVFKFKLLVYSIILNIVCWCFLFSHVLPHSLPPSFICTSLSSHSLLTTGKSWRIEPDKGNKRRWQNSYRHTVWQSQRQ